MVGFLQIFFSIFKSRLSMKLLCLLLNLLTINLKSSHLSLVDGQFVRTTLEVPPIQPPSIPISQDPSSSTPSSLSPEILILLNKILSNQVSLQEDISDIKNRLTILEKRKQPLDNQEANSIFRQVKDEFIDLQAGFEL